VPTPPAQSIKFHALRVGAPGEKLFSRFLFADSGSGERSVGGDGGVGRRRASSARFQPARGSSTTDRQICSTDSGAGSVSLTRAESSCARMPKRPHEWRATPRGAPGLPRMLLANGAHISTSGHPVSDLESQIPVAVPKDRCRAIWKIRETPKSSRRRPYGCRHPLARCCSSRPDKTLSSGLIEQISSGLPSTLRGAGRRLPPLPLSSLSMAYLGCCDE